MQLGVQQPDLGQMFGQDSLFNTLYGMNRQDEATANNAQNLSQAQQSQAFDAQNQPIALQQAAANVAHTGALTGLAQAQTPGEAAMSTMKTNAASADSSIPPEIRNHAALKKTLAGMSDDDMKMIENQVSTNMASPDPKVRAGAQMIYDNLPAMRSMKTKLSMEGANSARVAGIESGGAMARDKMEIEAGKYAKNSIDYLMTKGFQGNFQQQSGSWQMKAAQLEDSGDAAGAAKARQMADLARAADHDARAAAAYTGLAGKIDMNGMGFPTAAPPGAVAPQVPPLGTPTREATQAAPKAGTKVMHGGKAYIFMGGDPSSQSNWKEQ